MTDATYRVYHVAKQTKLSLAQCRQAKSQTQEQLIESAVQSHLPGIVDELLSVGLPIGPGDSPARWPVPEATLAALSKASSETGVPAVRLLLASLGRYCQGPKTASRAKRAPRAKGKAATGKRRAGRPAPRKRTRKS